MDSRSRTVLYLDLFSGAAGDMLLGALLDLGLELDALREDLAKMDLSGYELRGGAAGPVWHLRDPSPRSGISPTPIPPAIFPTSGGLCRKSPLRRCGTGAWRFSERLARAEAASMACR